MPVPVSLINGEHVFLMSANMAARKRPMQNAELKDLHIPNLFISRFKGRKEPWFTGTFNQRQMGSHRCLRARVAFLSSADISLSPSTSPGELRNRFLLAGGDQSPLFS